MSKNILRSAPWLIATCAAGAAIALAPIGNAETLGCTNGGASTLCQGPGNAQLVVTPQFSGGRIGQNGPYGPAGNFAPVGGR